MNRLTIVAKLYLGFGLVVAIMLCLVLVVGVNLQQLNESTDVRVHTLHLVVDSDAVSADLAVAMADLRHYGLTGAKVSLAHYQADIKHLQEVSLPRLRKEAAGRPEDLARIDSIQKMAGDLIRDYADPFIAKREAINNKQATMDDLANLSIELGDKGRVTPILNVIAALTQDAELANKSSRERNLLLREHTVHTLWIGMLTALVAALALSVSIGRNIARRLRGAIVVADNMAGGDLSEHTQWMGNDEISAVLRSLARMQGKLVAIIADIQRGATDLAISSEQISGSSQAVAKASSYQSCAAASMAASVEQLTVSINHLADNAEDAYRLAHQSGALSSQGRDVIRTTTREINGIAETVNSASARMTELGGQAQTISSIVSVIKEIADQTNLLALNAAIEAARAGEQGRGFAVVADEVRKLAERTSTATQEIATMIASIQSGSEQTLAVMRRSVVQVESGVEMSGQADAAVAQITTAAAQVEGVITDISSALQEQRVASTDVASNVEKIAQMTEETNNAVAETSQAAQGLYRLAESLKHSVSYFRLA